MGLRILDDDRPDFAILDFQREIGPEILAISLRSKLLKFGDYLGNNGKWSPKPWYFKLVKAQDKGPGAYRAGPEIVNQGSLALDLIEISIHGLGIVEQVTWPVLSAGADGGPLEAATEVPPEPAAAPQNSPLKDPEPKPAPIASPLEDEWPLGAETADMPVASGLLFADSDAVPLEAVAAVPPKPAPQETLVKVREPERARTEPLPEDESPLAAEKADMPAVGGLLSAGTDATLIPPEPGAAPEDTLVKQPGPERARAGTLLEYERLLRAKNAGMPAGGGVQNRRDSPVDDFEPVDGPGPLHLRKQPNGEPKPESVVLKLLREAPPEGRPRTRYGLTAAAVFAVTVLTLGALAVASRLFCVPFLGGDCKSSGNFEAAISCAKGEGASNGCAIVSANMAAGDAQSDREAAALVRTCISLKASPPCSSDSCIASYLNDFPAGEYRSELIELSFQTNERCRLAEADAARRSAGDPDRARREQEAGERRRLAALQLQQAEAEAGEKERLAAEERDRTEAAAKEKAVREAEETQRAQALAQEREKALAAAQEQANREAEEREKAEAAAKEKAARESEEKQRAQALAEEREKALAAAQEQAKREAEEREKAEAAAKERAAREAEEMRRAQALAEEREKALAAAQEQAKREAAEREKAEAAARDRAERDAEEQRRAHQAAQEMQTSAVPDGDYSGRTSREESCSPTAASVIVTIKDGKVCWEHNLNFANRWSGTIAPSGAIEARVRGRPGTSAAGQLVNGGTMSVEMTYPECTGRIRIKLLGMIGAASACPQ